MGLMVFIFVGGITSALIAINKNRNAAGWAIAGMLLPLISALVLVVSPALPGPNDTLGGY